MSLLGLFPRETNHVSYQEDYNNGDIIREHSTPPVNFAGTLMNRVTKVRANIGNREYGMRNDMAHNCHTNFSDTYAQQNVLPKSVFAIHSGEIPRSGRMCISHENFKKALSIHDGVRGRKTSLIAPGKHMPGRAQAVKIRDPVVYSSAKAHEEKATRESERRRQAMVRQLSYNGK